MFRSFFRQIILGLYEQFFDKRITVEQLELGVLKTNFSFGVFLRQNYKFMEIPVLFWEEIVN